MAASWTCDDVCRWLGECNLPGAVETFRANQVTGADLLEMTRQDIRDDLCAHCPFGLRKRIWEALRTLPGSRAWAEFARHTIPNTGSSPAQPTNSLPRDASSPASHAATVSVAPLVSDRAVSAVVVDTAMSSANAEFTQPCSAGPTEAEAQEIYDAMLPASDLSSDTNAPPMAEVSADTMLVVAPKSIDGVAETCIATSARGKEAPMAATSIIDASRAIPAESPQKSLEFSVQRTAGKTTPPLARSAPSTPPRRPPAPTLAPSAEENLIVSGKQVSPEESDNQARRDEAPEPAAAGKSAPPLPSAHIDDFVRLYLAHLMHSMVFSMDPTAKHQYSAEHQCNTFVVDVYRRLHSRLGQCIGGNVLARYIFGRDTCMDVHRKGSPKARVFNTSLFVDLELTFHRYNSKRDTVTPHNSKRLDKRDRDGASEEDARGTLSLAVSDTPKRQKLSSKQQHEEFLRIVGAERDQRRHRADGDTLVVNIVREAAIAPVYFPSQLANSLKPHQVDGVRFLWKVICRKESDGTSGCILAHSMGLGKTYQVVAFVFLVTRANIVQRACLPIHLQQNRRLRILIMCPVTVIDNWRREWHNWISDADRKRFIGHVYRLGQRREDDGALQDWFEHGGVMIMGYESFRLLLSRPDDDYAARSRRKMLTAGPDIVICDEAHRIKNPSSILYAALQLIETPSRICLTGYPLQNNLEEYWTMVDFTNPNFLGDLSSFRRKYGRDINNGMMADSLKVQVRISKKRLYVLQKLLDPFVFRLLNTGGKSTAKSPQSAIGASAYGGLAPCDKHEFTIRCRLTPVQYELYVAALQRHGLLRQDGDALSVDSATANSGIFEKWHEFLLIANHPHTYQLYFESVNQQADKAAERINHARGPTIVDVEDDSDLEADVFDRDLVCRGTGRPEDPIILSDADASRKHTTPPSGPGVPISLSADVKVSPASETLARSRSGNAVIEQILKKYPDLTDLRHSVKIRVLLSILTDAKASGDKTLVFSRSLMTLDYIEKILMLTTGESAISTIRLDGSTPSIKRQALIDKFSNNPTSVFLMSVNAGCLGVNCQAANRVVLFDAGWNPSLDEQAIARSYRIGQQKPVLVYRLYAYSTIEDALYKLNLQKVSLSKLVIDNKETPKRFHKNEMKRYFVLPERNTSSRLKPRQRYQHRSLAVIAEFLGGEIVDIQNHCDLLETFDPTLSDQDRREADIDLQAEKDRIRSRGTGKKKS